jgi:ArsR family transcriptional regulator, arsenate/arsenite/antimonite-responsive transcriptional repressor / arsenate reductase (thioredoxin)
MPAETLSPPPPFLPLVAHPLRWNLLEALARSDRRVHELVERLDKPANLVSYHLRLLRHENLVRERRSAADRRDVYYSLDLERLRGLFLIAGESLHPGLRQEAPAPAVGAMQQGLGRRVRVLFLCTHNSARSQLAEGILRHLGGETVEVFSAGAEPSRVHPLAIQAAAAQGIDISGQRSKSMDEFLGQRFDYVITVCDRASETCPTFPGEPERIHWSLPDPAAEEGPEESRYRAFQAAAIDLMTRIRYLLVLIGRRAG